jgi:hypothetical protein
VLSSSGRKSLPKYSKENIMAATFTKNGVTYNITDPLYVVTVSLAALSFTSLLPIGVLTVISFVLAAFSVIGVGWGVGFFLLGMAALVVGGVSAFLTFKRGFALVSKMSQRNFLNKVRLNASHYANSK